MNYLPQSGRQPLRLVVLSTWRSGSTFLTELLAANFKELRFVTYEPFLYKYPVSWKALELYH
jgi:hypothetical protein